MSATPPRLSDTPPLLAGGFVEVPAPHVPFGGYSDYMRMLREAQGETSCRTSCGVSPYLSHNSPKSPPNSPTVELSEEPELDLSDVYINREVPITDFIWDWSSRPNIEPPKQWRVQNINTKYSAKDKKKSQKKISNSFVFTFFLTNVISLIIGAGIGIWLKKKVFRSAL